MRRTAEQELARLELMSRYEADCRAAGHNFTAGVDEAGRGALAGPVVAGAVILPEDCKIIGVDDSKKLSLRQREARYAEICAAALAIGIGLRDHRVIDEINVLQAANEAMRDAVAALDPVPDVVLVDGYDVPELGVEQLSIVGGDGKSITIAAASIIAKVTRDRMMQAYHAEFPHYGFDVHKGYPTERHIAALKKYGPCAIHRRTFTIKKIRI
ncbi:MAG: ribonuclease HII [Clostridiales bacterium]|nr:ribonuclease HII [Clostridiales bacterium]